MNTKQLSILALFLFLLCSIVIFIGWWGIFLPQEKNSQKEVLFHIEKGEGGKEIAHNLKAQGLIRSALLFRFFVLTIGISDKLQAGDYILSPSLSPFQIAKKLSRGEIALETLTIIEGWNLREIEQYLLSKGIKISLPHELEGYLFPDTYIVPRSIAKEELIQIIQKNFEKKLDENLKSEIQRQGKTIKEIVIMASLLEKEVKSFPDKQLVAGILWKRLSLGIPLQVDATITYITGKKTTKISIQDTKIDSLYNTYKYPGLPPSPISNPGLDSIKAAIYPKESPYFYYLSTPDGKTIFTKTLQEHNLAKAKYLK